MPREVQFCTEQFSGIGGKVANSLGLGHAGLHCDRGAAPFYVTWDGTARGADWNASQRGAAKVTPFVKMPAHARVGFSDLINRQTNTTSANPMGWDKALALTADEDFALPTRGASQRFDIPVKAAGNGVTALDQPLPATGWMNSMPLIQHQCYDHLASKPTSDRRAAVLALVKVIYSALAGHKAFMEALSAGTLGIQPTPPAFFSARIGERFA